MAKKTVNKKTTKKGPGAPNKYETEIKDKLPEIESYAESGYTDKQIATALGINPSTLYDYKKKYPEFANALNSKKLKADKEIIDSLFKRAKGYDVVDEVIEYYPPGKDGEAAKIKSIKRYKKHIPGDTKAIMSWLWNRRADLFKYKMEVNHNIKVKPEDLEKLSDSELLTVLNSDNPEKTLATLLVTKNEPSTN